MKLQSAQTRCILVASVVFLMSFAIVACKRSRLQSSSRPQMITSNLVSEVKSKTGVDLPKSSRFILSTNYPRLDSDIWLFEIDSSNPAQFPRQLDLQSHNDDRKAAKEMERMSGISIGIPNGCYFGIWQVSNAQCHATLITTSNNDYLMLERLY